MYKYDIRNQIVAENRNKIFSELGIIGLLLAVALCIIFSGRTSNPFKVIRPESKEQLEKAYAGGTSYIELGSMELEYIGYNRESATNDVVYNCYNTSFDGQSYLVFLDHQSSTEDGQATLIISDYTIKAKLVEDNELFDIIASDYEVGTELFWEKYNVSPIIFDVANSDRTEALAVACFFILLLIICLLYIIVSFSHSNNILKNKEVLRLAYHGDIEQVIEGINLEVDEKKKFDNNKIKITERWILAFYSGKVLIRTLDQIEQFEITFKTKKQYGFVKIGYEVLIELNMDNGDTYRIPVESETEAMEIQGILKDARHKGENGYGMPMPTFKYKKSRKKSNN